MAEQDVNFQLVSTYLPLVVLLLRAGTLVVTSNLAALLSPAPNTLVMALCALAYFDAYAFRNSKLSVACGSLCPVALCLVVGHTTLATELCAETSSVVALWAVDLAWAVSSSSFLGIVVFRGGAPVDVAYASAAWALCGVVHAQMNCVVPDLAQVLGRTLVYYVSCSLYFFFRTAAPHTSIPVMHVFWHMMFVKNYVLLGSILATALTTSVVYYRRFAAAPRAAPRSENDDLMKELRAAKFASTSV
jgi:hypothetical protein